jgi:hypothetical protein
MPQNYFRQNADLLPYGYCIRRQSADNTEVRQAQREPGNNSGLEKMTNEAVTIQGVVEATVKLVQEKLTAKWGSLQDCCTDANEMIYAMLKDGIELQNETYIPSLERIQGVVVVDGQEVRHEWIRIEGVEYDVTGDQFSGSVVEYRDSEVTEW